MRRTILALACLLALPACARAAPDQESVFMDDDVLLHSGDRTSSEALAELKALGVDRVRLTLRWAEVQPDRDGLREEGFGPFDHAITAARKLGIDVLLNVAGPAPSWAAKRGVVRPDASAYGAFVKAVGERYDGDPQPKVTAWSLWNEPNQGAFLQPQWVRRHGRWRPASPRIYRRLAQAAVAGLQASGHGDDTILLGETAPKGNPLRGRTHAMRPGIFLPALFCLQRRSLQARHTRNCAFPGISGFAHHPYPVKAAPGRSDPNPYDIVLADRDRLARILDAAAAAHRLSPGLPMWFTEFGYQTNPPDPYRGLKPETQARWLAIAEQMARSDPRVRALTQFLLRDDEPIDRYPESDRRHWGTYQTGLEFQDGKPKPAYEAYRLPLVAPSHVAAGAPLRLWGLARPGTAGQTVKLQFRAAGASDFADAGGADPVLDADGAFALDVQPPGSGEWRFVWTAPADPSRQGNLLAKLLGQDAETPVTHASAPVAVRVG